MARCAKVKSSRLCPTRGCALGVRYTVCDPISPVTRFTRATARVVQCQNCVRLYTAQDLFAEMGAAATGRMIVYTSAARTIDRFNVDRERWRILDVGCGMSSFLCAATAYGCDCPPPASATFLRPGERPPARCRRACL